LAGKPSREWEERWPEFRRLIVDDGHSVREAGRQLGISVGQAENFWHRNKGRSDPTATTIQAMRDAERGHDLSPVPESVIRPMVQRPRIGAVIDLSPAPFAVPIPRPARSNFGQSTKCWTAVVFTDTHVPYHDQAALDVVYGIIRDVRPRVIVHLGDLLDCYKISRYTKDRNHLLNLQDEIDGAKAILHHVSQLAPEAEKVWLEGNHEERLEELLNTLPGTASELTQLRDIKAAMTWPALLRLGEIGWDFVPATGQAHHALLPRLITKHGTVVRKWSGMSGKGEWERYGKSGLSGHVHRVGQFYTSDSNGNHTWTECGCTCLLKPEYVEDPNWAHACVLVHFTPDGSRFSVEPVYIENGRALWRTTEYRAA
jgi:hypothetical protein